MIVKILGSASSNFHGVQYNDKKVEKGTGELMQMKNFPSFINEASSPQDVRDYLKAVSKNEKVKKPQFHAVISTKFQEHTKEELTEIAENFMLEMGYGQQPFIIVFHNDTANNHVHIVSTRVNKTNGKKINDSYEKLKAQKALSTTLEKLYGIRPEQNIDQLLQYKISSLKQLETLLMRNGYKLSKNTNDERALTIFKNGVLQRTLFENRILFDRRGNDNRLKQIKAIISKYKNLCSNKVFKVEDLRHLQKMLPEEKQRESGKPRIEFESELQKKLRDVFGIDVVFHNKEGQKPFGYTIIDHKTASVYKGSDIMKMNELFAFTSETIDKRLFESLKDYSLSDKTSRQILIEYLKHHYENAPKEFMLFETKKRKSKEVFSTIVHEVKKYVKTQQQADVEITKSEDGTYYAIHSRLHYVGALERLIGEKEYQKFLYPMTAVIPQGKESEDVSKERNRGINDLIFELNKSSGSGKDPMEAENKKRRKKRR